MLKIASTAVTTKGRADVYKRQVLLDPTRTNTVVTIPNIQDVVINGQSLGVGGYVDIGIIDTMKDLFVNFIGAVVFSITGFFYRCV